MVHWSQSVMLKAVCVNVENFLACIFNQLYKEVNVTVI